MNVPTPTPLGDDWFRVDWLDVWRRTGLGPDHVPGVVMLAPHPEYSHPYKVHLTHLRVLGFPIPDVTPLPLLAPLNLRQHQVEGLRFIRARRGTLLADEQRVGKTPTIMYSHDPEDGIMVVVGPLAARAVWHEWAARRFGWCHEVGCSICDRVPLPPHPFPMGLPPSFMAGVGRKFAWDGDKEILPRVIFAHFAIIPTWRQLFEHVKIGTLVVDEAHLSGVQNRKSITIESIRWLNTVAKRTIFASGTPLFNKPRGLWPILDIITPGAFGGFWDFARRYCDAKPGAHGWSADGASNLDELQERLRDVMLRRRWSDVAKNLPKMNRSIEVVPLSAAKRDQVEELCARIRSQGGTAKTVIGDLARMRKLYATEKTDAAYTTIRATLEDKHSVVAWTWHRDVAVALAQRLTAEGATVFGPIHGDTKPNDREAIIESARVCPLPCVIVATMASLATAVNLSFCSHEVFVELDWSPPNIAQAEMRPYDGQHPISITYLVADCDVDQKLADALISKLSTSTQLGLDAGAGSVESVLRASLGVESAQTLSALADAVIAEVA